MNDYSISACVRRRDRVAMGFTIMRALGAMHRNMDYAADKRVKLFALNAFGARFLLTMSVCWFV